MRIILVRHGETVDNVAGVYAGITDSALSQHGVIQAKRLGSHLSATDVKISHIFASDLQRAFKTAEAIVEAQSPPPSEITKSTLIREQDFGFYEGKQFFERPREGNKSGKDAHLEAHRNDPGFKDVESKELMRHRAKSFIDQHILPLMQELQDHNTVAIVSHGIILGHIWRAILALFHPSKVAISNGVQAGRDGLGLEFTGGWSNTGYMELEISSKAKLPNHVPSVEAVSPQAEASSLSSAQPATDAPRVPLPAVVEAVDPAVPAADQTPSSTKTVATSTEHQALSLVVKAVNSQEHLKGLKKTRGGIGSLKHDSSQKTVDSFFKKRRTE